MPCVLLHKWLVLIWFLMYVNRLPHPHQHEWVTYPLCFCLCACAQRVVLCEETTMCASCQHLCWLACAMHGVLEIMLSNIQRAYVVRMDAYATSCPSWEPWYNSHKDKPWLCVVFKPLTTQNSSRPFSTELTPDLWSEPYNISHSGNAPLLLQCMFAFICYVWCVFMYIQWWVLPGKHTNPGLSRVCMIKMEPLLGFLNKKDTYAQSMYIII
jgi:hypothetical protein